MRVPLEKEPFAPVTLTFDQEKQLKWLSDSMVDATYAHYEEFVSKHNRTLEKDKWKPVISRENVTIYKRSGKGDLGAYTPTISLTNHTTEQTNEYWRMPTVVGVGTLAGALDDMLYGLLAMTKTETDVRTTYIKDEAPDSRVLATVIKPSKEDPLKALVLRWSLIYQFVHKFALRPRDLVYLESVGSRILPSGERVGYAVMQSVDVPGCDELKDLNIVRCKFSTCYLLRDAGNGAVELYMRAYMDPGGRVGDRLATFAAASSLIAIWRVLLCGQYKKLAWMMHRAIATRPSYAIRGASDVFSQAREDRTTACPVCEKSLSVLRSHSRCDICLTKVCTRCIDKRKLTHVGLNGELTRVVTRICRTCITVASRTSARDVAISEYVPVASWGIRTHSAYGSSSSGSNTIPSPSFSSVGPEKQKRKLTLLDSSLSISSYGSTQYEAPIDCDRDSSFAYGYEERLTTPTNGRDLGRSISAEEEAFSGVDPQQLELWMRMNKLRVAAEETFMLTKQNASAMVEAQHYLDNSRGPSTRS